MSYGIDNQVFSERKLIILWIMGGSLSNAVEKRTYMGPHDNLQMLILI